MEKNNYYLVSVCFINTHYELFSEPYGLFENLEEAEQFALNKINQLKTQLKVLKIDDEEIEECTFDFTIKNILLDYNKNERININSTPENIILFNPQSKKWVMSPETETIPEKTFHKICISNKEEKKNYYEMVCNFKWDEKNKQAYVYQINKKLEDYFRFYH